MKRIITRFAPSPTGYLHIGGLRTALFNYLYARANGGKFLLRIEDTDLARNSKEASEAILEAFKWVGLDYDDEVIYQSKRFDIYSQYIQKLLSQGRAYYCYMSKEELNELRESQKARGETPRYDNRWRDFKGVPPNDIKPVVRIKAPLEGSISFKDGLKGHIHINAKELDDFIIARSDGSPTYNFVVAIDDALMGVTDVIRGDDHLSNTPKQILIYHALDFDIPRFFHIPMILNPQGHKLSKRDGAMGVMDYQKLGFLPEALLNFLVRLGWSYGDEEIFSLESMLKKFSPDSLNSSPSAYNEDKLLWLNQHYLRLLDNDMLEKLLVSFNAPKLTQSARAILYAEFKERAKTLLEFANGLNDIINAPENYDEKMLSKLDENAKSWLREIIDELHRLDSTHHLNESIDACLHHFAEAKNIKLNRFMPALRVALLGKSGGISLVSAMSAIGIAESIRRIKKFLES